MPRLVRPDGCSLWYEVAGDARRQPLVLVEGLGGTVEGWRRNVPGLAAELFVVAFDLRGNGRSDPPPEGATVDTFGDDLVALLDELAIVRAHLFGFSFGGMVAIDVALRHGRRVRSLVLGATHAGRPHAVRSTASVPKDRPWQALYSARFLAEHPDEVEDDRRARGSHPGSVEARRRQWEAVRAFDAYDRLMDVEAPTLVLQGTHDRLIAPANAEAIAERIRDAELVLVEGAGHLFHVERPELTDELVLDFIRRHRDG